MTDTREKLAELLAGYYGVDPAYYGVDAYGIADHFIANGVRLEEKQATSDKSKWIPVAERMPERFQPVIICRKNGNVEPGYRDVNDWWRVYGTRIKTVTHWMPLPEAPKEGQ